MSQPKPRRASLFPHTLAACIEPLTRPIFKTQGLAGSRIVPEWPTIVGARLGRHCIPQKLAFPQGKRSNGTLTIAVENGFTLEVQHMQALIIERLALYFGYKAVTRVVISSTFLSATKASPAAPVPVLPAHCARLTERIEDKELQAALQSLANSLSGQS